MRFCVAACFAIACTKPNPSYCEQESDCPTGLTCLVGSRTCIIAPDAPDAPDARVGPFIVGTGNYAVSLPEPLIESVFLTGMIDTHVELESPCEEFQPAGWLERGQPNTCFIIAREITIDSLKVLGNRPIAILAATTLRLTGTLDVASHSTEPDTTIGAGDGIGCEPTIVRLPTASGGGAGGTFGTSGGYGGYGTNSSATGGLEQPVPSPPSFLRAGCDGQEGAGDYSDMLPVGRGGGGVYIGAGERIELDTNALINASGSGAKRAPGDSLGGSGGGSGGMIVLNAPAIDVGGDVILVANGGGGAAGATASACGGCTGGGDPNPLTPYERAAYGFGGASAGGTGASFPLGGTQADPGGPGQSSTNAGGGGGGGGVGFIQSNRLLNGLKASPPPVIVP